MSVHDRIDELIKDLGLSKNQFSLEIGTSSAMISKITKNKVNFGVDIMQKIINRYPDINSNWLLTGVGEIRKYQPFINSLGDIPNNSIDQNENRTYHINKVNYELTHKGTIKLSNELMNLKGEHKVFFEEILKFSSNLETLDEINSEYLNIVFREIMNSSNYLINNTFDYKSFKENVLKAIKEVSGFKNPIIQLNSEINTFIESIKHLDDKNVIDSNN